MKPNHMKQNPYNQPISYTTNNLHNSSKSNDGSMDISYDGYGGDRLVMNIEDEENASSLHTRS